MWLTRLSLTRPVTITVFLVAIFVLGFYALRKMRTELQPPVEFPFVSVVTTYPGASSDEVETLLTKPIEDAVSGINGVRQVNSVSQYGISQVGIQFHLGTNLDVAYNDVRAKVEAIRARLPKDITPPVVSKLDINTEPILYLSLTGNRSAAELRDLADDVIKDRLASVPGVAAVTVQGGQVREIQVAIDKGRLDAYGLSLASLLRSLQAANLNLPSGKVTEGEQEYGVRVLGEFRSVDELKNLQISLPNRRNPNMPGPFIRLSDVAEVKDTVAERTILTRTNGKEDVSIVIAKASDANAVEISREVKKVIAQIERDYPDLKITITEDAADFIQESLFDLRVALALAVVLVVAIVFLFLYNLRGTFIVALAIPASIFATFIVIYFAGFTINTMTMLALSLAVGILVDDAIVVLENIYRHLSLGEEPVEAAYNGRTEIGLAAITITFIDVVVFLPIAFMGGISGQFFRSFGLTVAAATLFSLIVSFTITPMLASRWYRKGEVLEKPKGFFQWFDKRYRALERGYRHLLAWALRHRGIVILIGNGALITLFLVIIAAAVQGKPLLPFRFAPGQDQGLITVTIKMPPDASLESTDRVARQIEQAALTLKDAKYVTTLVGTTGGGFFGAGDRGPRFAELKIKLHQKKALLDSLIFWKKSEEYLRTTPDVQIAAELRQKVGTIPGAQVSINVVSGFGRGGFNAPILIALSGKDTMSLVETAEQLRNVIAKLPGIKDADLSWSSGKPELQVSIDRERAAALGISTAEIATALRTALEGNTDVKYREFGKEYPIRVQLRPEDRARISEIGSVVVTYLNGVPVRLADVTKIRLAEGPTKIERTDRQRRVLVLANLLPGYSPGNMQRVIQKAMDEAGIIPPGVYLKWEGETRIMAEEGTYMGQALLLAFILVYLLMVALFENWLYPLVIMFSQPQALVGALLALILTRSELSIVSMIGIIMLVGLVGKNAILLVDYTNTLRKRGRARNEALLEAGPIRLRPIAMTTTAMVLGMLPVALALGRGSEFRAPMGIAVIGGLLLSTLLTLVVIPCMYTLFDDLSTWWARVLKRARPQPLWQAPWEPEPPTDGTAAIEPLGTAEQEQETVEKRV